MHVTAEAGKAASCAITERRGFWHWIARIPCVRRDSLKVLAMRAMHAAEATQAAAAERSLMSCLVAVSSAELTPVRDKL